MQGRRIVDAVAEIADRMSGPLQGADDALLLLGIDLDEEIGARRECHSASSLSFVSCLAGHHRLRIEPDRSRPDAP